MAEKSPVPSPVTVPANFADTFFSKLKEQSFTIILLLGIMYYQNAMFQRQLEEYKKMIQEKEQLILKLTDDERNRLVEHEKYLIQQRDTFIDYIKEEVRFLKSPSQ